MQIRKNPLENDSCYHVFSRSIAGYTVFNDTIDFGRIIELLDLYRYVDFVYKYSAFLDLSRMMQLEVKANFTKSSDKHVQIIAYCIMPTHLHLLLRQQHDAGISKFMSKILNSYSRYFNTRHNRQGPLWSGRFKSVLVENDEQLLHLTRYIHLNPTSAGLTKNALGWAYSSLEEYIISDKANTYLTESNGIFSFSPKEYLKFINDQKNFQRELSIIKSKLIDNYVG